MLLEGEFRLQLNQTGVMICLSEDNQLNARVKDSKGRSIEVQLEQGWVIYLADDTTLVMSGKGGVACIYQIFVKK